MLPPPGRWRANQNQKPWLDAEVCSLLKARVTAFRFGATQTLRREGRELTAGIKRNKATCAQKIPGLFSFRDLQIMWRTLSASQTNFRHDNGRTLLYTLNRFYTHFEDPTTPSTTKLTPPPGEEPLSVSPAEVRRILQGINPHKSAGPDNIPEWGLRDCTDQLCPHPPGV